MSGCTGAMATWCPNCGDCKCKLSTWDGGPSSVQECPLHARGARHPYMESAVTTADGDHNPWVAIHGLPDGRVVTVDPLMFGRARLGITRPEDWGNGFFDDVYYYESIPRAIAAAQTWAIERGGEGEPDDWFRHPASGRRRPHGNPDTEFVRP